MKVRVKVLCDILAQNLLPGSRDDFGAKSEDLCQALELLAACAGEHRVEVFLCPRGVVNAILGCPIVFNPETIQALEERLKMYALA